MFWKKKTIKNRHEKEKDEKEKKDKKEKPETSGGRKRGAGENRKQPERPEAYVMKKNTMMKTLRIVLWVILLFVFMRGVVSCLQRDSAREAGQIIQDFREEFAEYKDDSAELMGFAQNFAREYLTYERRREDDYAQRIRPYVSDDVYSRAGELTGFQGKAEAAYVQAYRKENYSENQYDIYVLADVAYELEEVAERDGEEIINTTVRNQTVTLKIPIFAENGKYVVEGIPMIVNDSMKMTGYSVPAFSGAAVTDGRVSLVTEAVTSFLTAYYEQDQNVIEYYLTNDADRTKFSGLSGRYTFHKMEQVKCFETEGNIICLVEFKVADAENGNYLMQSMNLTVVQNGDRYYIRDLNTKTGHL